MEKDNTMRGSYRPGWPVGSVVVAILQAPKRLWNETQRLFHAARMRLILKPADRSARDYLNVQLRRTLSKRGGELPQRGRQFIAAVVNHIVPAQSRVLCVGCRNVAELNNFRAGGVASVVGIDLYSTAREILVMDMHAMTFAADSFDLVYSSHSLEHAREPARVIAEFLRVVRPRGVIAIEVPVNYPTRGADLVDFKSVENLLAAFAPHVVEVLWSEHCTAATGGEVGTEAVRVIFRVAK